MTKKGTTHRFSLSSPKSLLIGDLSLLGENPLLIGIGLLALLPGVFSLLAPGPSPMGLLALDPTTLSGLLALDTGLRCLLIGDLPPRGLLPPLLPPQPPRLIGGDLSLLKRLGGGDLEFLLLIGLLSLGRNVSPPFPNGLLSLLIGDRSPPRAPPLNGLLPPLRIGDLLSLPPNLGCG